jgi:glycosyltransferase involved in cell wall biosynthesis
MKIYFNRKPVTGPWGGGNKTLCALIAALQNDHEVIFELKENIDIIFCFDPRPNAESVWYQDFISYKIKNPNTKIVQRVGDVGTHSKPELTSLLKQIVQLDKTDFFIFPSIWARKMINHKDNNYEIIQNAPMADFFQGRKNKKNTIVPKEEVKIVTHHWSNNPKKGFEIYQLLGKYIKKNKIAGKKIVFDYYGRYNDNYKSDGINLFPPIDVKSLIKKIPNYDLYLTASIEEAGANHVLEAMACGLPVLYSCLGGSIVEYCENYGIEYSDFNNLVSNLEKAILNYENIFEKNKMYKKTIDEAIKSYICILEKLNGKN